MEPYFPSLCHTSDLKIGAPLTALPGALHHRVSARTGWPGVSNAVNGCNSIFYLQALPQHQRVVWP